LKDASFSSADLRGAVFDKEIDPDTNFDGAVRNLGDAEIQGWELFYSSIGNKWYLRSPHFRKRDRKKKRGTRASRAPGLRRIHMGTVRK